MQIKYELFNGRNFSSVSFSTAFAYGININDNECISNNTPFQGYFLAIVENVIYSGNYTKLLYNGNGNFVL
ncbi:hypothetical protein GCM10008025_08640 [Ornithinibacillus halotolerans]|uniref:Uncharacterized protein n=1 Tax=Ornithinibacillus halotolerans TaxID=1274357 RepID=A0A916RUP7_9BACI|nr:hypothetical protein GCM10008025_08640 [Ornithinibacillus halotolerans]